MTHPTEKRMADTEDTRLTPMEGAITPEEGRMSEQQLATTVEDWHAQRVGEAVLDALNELDGEVWFDLGCALACDDRFRAAVQDAGRRKSVDRERRLLEAARAALASLEQPETYPADVLAVKKWLTDAVAEYPRPDHRAGGVVRMIPAEREE